jgi:hypothetical protein
MTQQDIPVAEEAEQQDAIHIAKFKAVFQGGYFSRPTIRRFVGLLSSHMQIPIPMPSAR